MDFKFYFNFLFVYLVAVSFSQVEEEAPRSQTIDMKGKEVHCIEVPSHARCLQVFICLFVYQFRRILFMRFLFICLSSSLGLFFDLCCCCAGEVTERCDFVMRPGSELLLCKARDPE